MLKPFCPFRSTNEYLVDCLPNDCPLYDKDEKMCAIVSINQQLKEISDHLQQTG